MPPFAMVTKDFLKAVLSGKKRLLKMSKVNFCNPPAYDEISVTRLYGEVVARPGMAAYFPDKYAKGRQCCKAYMYNIWNTLHPADVKQVIDHSMKVRFSVENEKVKEDCIILTEEWKSQIDDMPFISKQKGRMCALLKQKSKIATVPKPRITYDPFDFAKRKQVEPNPTQSTQQTQPQTQIIG